MVRARFADEQPTLLALPPTGCDVSLRLFREVHKDCRISVEGNYYLVAHRYVGKRVTVRLHHASVRIYHDDLLLQHYAVPPGKGAVVGDATTIYAAVRADRAMNARKYAHPLPGKACATISPSAAPHEIEVAVRPLEHYNRLGGVIAHA